MCRKSNSIAHDLFYLQDAERERQAPHGRFSIHRGKDFSVAYSYSTPIAVYPDKGGFVLLDSSHFSNTTSKHQCSIRQAIPYHVQRVECDWLGKNDIWYAPRYDTFETQFRKFTRDVAKGILNIGKSDSDYAYSRKRNETLNRLNGLRKLAEGSSIMEWLEGRPDCTSSIKMGLLLSECIRRWPHLIEGKLINGCRNFTLLRNEAWLNPLTMNTSHCAIAQPDPILLELAGLPHDLNPVPPRHEPEQQDELPLCA